MSELPLKNAWEKRAAEKGNSLNSVLFQGLSDKLNEYIHEFHWNVIAHEFLNLLPQNANIIDLGCGYGRLSKLVKQRRPDLSVTGTDFSLNYCRMYKEIVSASIICSDINNLPFAAESFEGMLAVTSLMYVEREKREVVFENAMKLLKPGGKAIFIDPGEEFKRLLSIIKPTVAKRSTGGYGFSRSDYTRLAESAGARLVNRGGMPAFSLLLPVVLVVAKFHGLQDSLLTMLAKTDMLFSHFDSFTVHRWMVVEKNQ